MDALRHTHDFCGSYGIRHTVNGRASVNHEPNHVMDGGAQNEREPRTTTFDSQIRVTLTLLDACSRSSRNESSAVFSVGSLTMFVK